MSQATTHIEMRPNHDGQLRAFIAGTRVRVQDVYALAEIQGASPDEIVQALPHLTLGQVHAALSYYFDHREAVLQEIREDDDYVHRSQAANGPGPLRKLLDANLNFDLVQMGHAELAERAIHYSPRQSADWRR